MANGQEQGGIPRIKILFVDDEQHVLNALARVFHDEQFQVFTAPSGKEGLRLLEKGIDAQIVIADYRMPEMHGVDFLRQVHLRWPDTVRMVLSGHSDSSAVVAAVNDGQIYKFITKPWDNDELKIAVSNAAEKYMLQLQNRQLTDELRQKNMQLERANSCLSRIVAENTSHLAFQNRIFRVSHIILASLPVAVIGLDAKNEIAVCNKNGARLLGVNEVEAIGKDSQKLFPEQLRAFAEEVLDNGKSSRILKINGADLSANGLVVKNGDENYVSLLFSQK